MNAVVFDVGETLVDETRSWERAADACGVSRFTLMALVGGAIVCGESHRSAFDRLGVEPQPAPFTSDPVHVRRGPWGYLQEAPERAIRISSLDELPGVLS